MGGSEGLKTGKMEKAKEEDKRRGGKTGHLKDGVIEGGARKAEKEESLGDKERWN